MIHYIGKVIKPNMSILEIILYSLLGLILTIFLFKWLIWDKKHGKKKKENPYEKEEKEE